MITLEKRSIKEEVIYYSNYKQSLDDYLNSDTGLNILKYMEVVEESKRIESYIKHLEAKLV